MIELQKFIVSELKKIHPRVYQEWAPEDAVFPYVVYRFPTSNPNERREDFILEIDIWDQPPDGSTVTLQQLADQIDSSLNGVRYTSEDWNTRIDRINRLMIPDPDETIRRRQLRYELRTFEAGGM
ncbi:tail completion protein gp17 [Thermoflavimicrobium dichotomicum]|uniref:Uncharacterized protein n=1 Tax=Thermoflavimicrobium dichotomicum TaxID=46223 RepID=A0A1I3UIB4_9BACL|nr:DUF3168 domain-containing protein [Thermoflavimicrobium dichotomicum]SFJ83234.1 Protein of unknown function [Thermoflavimicrobium dichotomicum]